MVMINILVNSLDTESSETNIIIDSQSTLQKLFKIIEIYLEIPSEIKYSLFYKNKNIKEYPTNSKVHQIFFGLNHSIDCQEDLSNTKFELSLIFKDKTDSSIKLECQFELEKKVLTVPSTLSFHNLKFNLLALFPDLKEENFCIMYENNDITNYYNDSKILIEIFGKNKISEEFLKINLVSKAKNIVEYHKVCSFCENKALNICNKCSMCNCEDCVAKDSHSNNQETNYVKIHNFKKFETDFLERLKNILNLKDSEKKKILIFDTIKDKIGIIEKKFDDQINLLKSLKELQLNNLNSILNTMTVEFKPEIIPDEISKLQEETNRYYADPFYDCEESMKKLLDLEKQTKYLTDTFENLNTSLSNFENKISNCGNIQKNIDEVLKSNLTQSKVLFKSTNKKEKGASYDPIMKVYDNKSILIYEHNTEEFRLINFIDVEGKFKENFNNYVQINYSKEGRLLIITGSPCQKLFSYNLSTNEMEYINTLKHNHNWWPVLLITENSKVTKPVTKDNKIKKINNKLESSSSINLYCLSGTYTSKAEKLNFSLTIKNKLNELTEWKEIPSLNVSHGQASAIVRDDNIVYVFFGYDCKFNSISVIEKWNMQMDSAWEIIKFENPDSISSFIYYNSILQTHFDFIYILGGRKEINEVDFVYKFEFDNFNLTKSEYYYELNDSVFSSEKKFINILKSEKNSISMESKNKKTKIISNNDSINCDINTEMNPVYVLFDCNNNIHVVEKLEHKLINFTIN